MTDFTISQKIYMTFVKRPLGFSCALISLLILSPVFLLTIILLHFTNKGAGVFFIQERPGKNEKIFKVLKFKTMTDDKDEFGNLLPDAERMTPIGKIVRSASIDELPQLINILKGDMAFIGPRPLLVHYLPLYSINQRQRHDVTPGMSGWAQINGRNNISWSEKFDLDIYYVNHIGIKLDIKIFLMTIKKVFMQSDINSSKEGIATMEAFNGEN